MSATHGEGRARMMPVLAIPSHTVGQFIGSTLTIGGLAESGGALAGEIGSILGGLGGALGVVLLIIYKNAERRREYDAEILAAEKRGEDRQALWTQFWMQVASGRTPYPTHPLPETPPVAIKEDDDP